MSGRSHKALRFDLTRVHGRFVLTCDVCRWRIDGCQTSIHGATSVSVLNEPPTCPNPKIPHSFRIRENYPAAGALHRVTALVDVLPRNDPNPDYDIIVMAAEHSQLHPLDACKSDLNLVQGEGEEGRDIPPHRRFFFFL